MSESEEEPLLGGATEQEGFHHLPVGGDTAEDGDFDFHSLGGSSGLLNSGDFRSLCDDADDEDDESEWAPVKSRNHWDDPTLGVVSKSESHWRPLGGSTNTSGKATSKIRALMAGVAGQKGLMNAVIGGANDFKLWCSEQNLTQFLPNSVTHQKFLRTLLEGRTSREIIRSHENQPLLGGEDCEEPDEGTSCTINERNSLLRHNNFDLALDDDDDDDGNEIGEFSMPLIEEDDLVMDGNDELNVHNFREFELLKKLDEIIDCQEPSESGVAVGNLVRHPD